MAAKLIIGFQFTAFLLCGAVTAAGVHQYRESRMLLSMSLEQLAQVEVKS
jgi:hypothetical protein